MVGYTWSLRALPGGVLERKSKGLPRPYSMDKKKTKAKRGQLKGIHSRGCSSRMMPMHWGPDSWVGLFWGKDRFLSWEFLAPKLLLIHGYACSNQSTSARRGLSSNSDLVLKQDPSRRHLQAH